ncbi:DNA polymerase III subunit beta [Paenibacillus sp. TRM 82003]|uniref:DNA polymerase III subunit beta n=1 Tax=Kineococcus sp. TRM81007 TaxID=2925831 RepID=UPI001F55F0C1|nr:DNA polymerase III subunit beta [Kineococcus sp. TRM81007]MCI2240541.1 DNA polymerase III subunit beta [Kineococcus sp. TRM81007]MCI3918920.1 DNA polymerase III subunit beta [Paenibacillus sp. TRM 82003]
MELQVERDVLADAVAWAARALPSRPPVPVLAGVLLEAGDDGSLQLSTFDYEVSARVEVPAEVRTAGKVLVSGRLLADISRSLPNRPVTLTTEGSKVVVTCGASRFTLLTMSVDEYPSLPAMPAESGTVPGSEFTEAVAQVTIAASRDETLPILTGVRLEIEGGRLTLLATDRYRLAVRELRWNPSTPDFSTAALVRARTLSDVARSLGSTSTLRVALADGGSDLIGFSAEGRQSTSLLVDGEYPKVRALFPAESPTHAVVSTSALVEAVKRVALVAERNTPVRLRFEDGVLSLEAGQGEDAQATEALEASLVGESISIAFNPQFLLDGLGALSAPYARLSFTQSTRPAVITGQAEADGEDDDSYRYLLMPVRLAG